MTEFKNEVERLKKLIPTLRVYDIVAQNLRDGKNGFFTERMKRFKFRLRKKMLDNR